MGTPVDDIFTLAVAFLSFYILVDVPMLTTYNCDECTGPVFHDDTCASHRVPMPWLYAVQCDAASSTLRTRPYALFH